MDHCAYFCKYDDDNFYILLLYVDDVVVTKNSKSQISTLKTKLARVFNMKDLGVVNRILKMKVL